MAVLKSLQSAALRLTGTQPNVFFGSSEQIAVELCDLVNEVAHDIADHGDWQKLIKTVTYQGDGTTKAFPLPEDYARQLQRSDVQDLNNWVFGFSRSTDINEFMFAEARNFQTYPGLWTIVDDEMRFTPAPPAAQSATWPYITSYWAYDNQTLTTKPEFTNDSDDFLLSDRLLTLGLVYRWRKYKAMEYGGDEEDYLTELNRVYTNNAGSKIYRKRSYRNYPGVRMAWPWALGYGE